jgi:hypothetical protein
LPGTVKSCSLQAAWERHRSAGNDCLRLTTSGASAPNMELSASAASVAAVAQPQTARVPAGSGGRDLIDLGAGEEHGFDRASARSHARMQRIGSP